ncbi:IclR family transcriptional regulator [Streptomyces sp. NPDC026672]|uniref:IclR family transcriptional regulator n=1 Tax=unclassified Streptomyces TaxID=2593676 RepID=UPI0033E25524
MPYDPDRPTPHDCNTVLGKTVTLLESFTAEDRSVSFTELRARTGFPKATLHRMLTDLVGVHLIDRTPQGGYRLGRQLFQLGMRVSTERRLLEVAIPFMEDLYERTHETVHLGIVDHMEVVYVAKIGGHRQALAPSRVGGRMPLYCTAIGKALLAHSPSETLARVVGRGLAPRTHRTITSALVLRRQLEQVRATGVAFEYEESAAGIACVAAPVLDTHEGPVAAISVVGSLPAFRPERHARAVRDAATGTAAALRPCGQGPSGCGEFGSAGRNRPMESDYRGTHTDGRPSG